MMNRGHASEIRTLIVGFAAVVLLTVWSLGFAMVTNSNIIELEANAFVAAVLIDGMALYLVYGLRKSDGRLDEKRYVPLLNLMRSLLLIVVCINAFVSSVNNLFYPDPMDDFALLFIYIGGLVVVNLILFVYVRRVATAIQSEFLKTDALEWRIDLTFNCGVVAIFGLSYFLKNFCNHALLLYFDPVVCMVLAPYLVVEPVRILKRNFKILTEESS